MVISIADEFVHVGDAGGDPVPKDVIREPKAVVRRALPEDPLGYDISDIEACALAMAEAALSGRNRTLVDAEIATVKKRFGGVE